MKQYIEVGKIVTVQGIKGEVRINPMCDTPEFLLKFKKLYLDEKGERFLEVEKARVQKNINVIKFKGLDSIEEGNRYRGKMLYIDKSEVKLPKSTYFIQDLVGLSVIDSEDESIVYGELTDVSQTGANDVYHIQQGEKTFLIPAIKQVVIKTDIENGVMKIKPIKGLFDDED